MKTRSLLTFTLITQLGCEPEPVPEPVPSCSTSTSGLDSTTGEPEPEPTGPCIVYPPYYPDGGTGICYCGPGCFDNPPHDPCMPVDRQICEDPA
jgi:hypothetical protein